MMFLFFKSFSDPNSGKSFINLLQAKLNKTRKKGTEKTTPEMKAKRKQMRNELYWLKRHKKGDIGDKKMKKLQKLISNIS